ncbi:hypothetical protein [Campylobacter rectus]|uniref:hypothetical protein n=1 Tax=Campylobacter rectus TaxID=203 RepID=UPI0028DC7B87|nr:hypothetical protein [Campylobacter rectus]
MSVTGKILLNLKNAANIVGKAARPSANFAALNSLNFTKRGQNAKVNKILNLVKFTAFLSSNLTTFGSKNAPLNLPAGCVNLTPPKADETKLISTQI